MAKPKPAAPEDTPNKYVEQLQSDIRSVEQRCDELSAELKAKTQELRRLRAMLQVATKGTQARKHNIGEAGRKRRALAVAMRHARGALQTAKTPQERKEAQAKLADLQKDFDALETAMKRERAARKEETTVIQ